MSLEAIASQPNEREVVAASGFRFDVISHDLGFSHKMNRATV